MPGWALQGRRLLEMSGKACPRLELGHGTPHGSPFRSLLGRGLVFSLAMGLLLETLRSRCSRRRRRLRPDAKVRRPQRRRRRMT
jgi:hypothetical protein